jgi:hypothetical protein
MASAQDNNIVIECSPYGDSETEIVNLKTPSFELIPMGNILDFGNSINIFIGLSYLIGAILILLLIITRILSYVKDNEPSVQDTLMKSSLNGLYLTLFVVGLILFFPQSETNDFITVVYVIFGIAMVFALILRIAQKYNEPDSNKLINELVNVVFPGFMIHKRDYNIIVFLVAFGLLYVLLSSIRLSFQLKPEEAFSPIGLLSSYCLLQGLNYMYSNSSYSNGADGEEAKIDD